MYLQYQNVTVNSSHLKVTFPLTCTSVASYYACGKPVVLDRCNKFLKRRLKAEEFLISYDHSSCLFENKKGWWSVFLCILHMKEKWLAVGKFVIIKCIFKSTNIFDLGLFCLLLFFIQICIEVEFGVWVVSMHSRSFYSY